MKSDIIRLLEKRIAIESFQDRDFRKFLFKFVEDYKYLLDNYSHQEATQKMRDMLYG